MAGINSTERCIQYRKCKLVLESEEYLDSVRQKCFRDALVRLRLAISDISVHKNRYKETIFLLGMCPFCPGVEEDNSTYASDALPTIILDLV